MVDSVLFVSISLGTGGKLSLIIQISKPNFATEFGSYKAKPQYIYMV